MKKQQKSPLVDYFCESVRGESLYAFREMLKLKNLREGIAIDEGEALSEALEGAVLKEYRGAGKAFLAVRKANYFDTLDKD